MRRLRATSRKPRAKSPAAEPCAAEPRADGIGLVGAELGVTPDGLLQVSSSVEAGVATLVNAVRTESSDTQHLAGALCRCDGDATSEARFQICLQDRPDLDGGAAPVFGKVIEGMDVVHKILPGDRIQDVILTSVH